MTKLIAVWSPKGGVGKTTITLHLADALSRDGFRVLVYDADDQKSLTEVFQSAEPDSFGFDVTSSSPGTVSGYDYMLVDFPPTLKSLTTEHKKILELANAVISPVRASRLDLMSFKAVSSFIPEDRLIRVLSAYDQRIKDQVEVRVEIASEYAVVSYSSIYSRTINLCKTVFSDSVQKLYGIKKAQQEMQKLVRLVK